MTTRGQNASKALNDLLEGNARYSAGEPLFPNQTPQRREELIPGQNPWAAILACSDSRVPPELLFDQGLGDLFVIRVAGNVASGTVLGSIEYAVAHLHIPLLVVLGHSHCGAIGAALSDPEEMEGHIGHVTSAIQPALEMIDFGAAENKVNVVARIHAKRTAHTLRTSTPVLSEQVHAGRLEVIAAYYDLRSGQVEVLDDAL